MAFCLCPWMMKLILTVLHSERPKLYTILAFLSAIGLIFSSLKVKYFECNRVKFICSERKVF